MRHEHKDQIVTRWSMQGPVRTHDTCDIHADMCTCTYTCACQVHVHVYVWMQVHSLTFQPSIPMVFLQESTGSEWCSPRKYRYCM